MVAAISLGDLDDALNNQLIVAAVTDQIAWPNKIFTPTKGVAYLKPEKAARTRSPVGFGADSVMRWDLTYQVGVFVSMDTGEQEQARLASLVMAAFPRGLTLTTPQGIIITVSHTTAQVPVPFGDWSNLPVLIFCFATEPP